MPEIGMFDIADVVACSLMLGYCFIMAVLMPGRGMWVNRLIVWVLTISLGAQIMAPWSAWIPRVTWHSAVLHLTMALALVIWRREAMHFIRCRFVVPAEAEDEPRRRVSDLIGAENPGDNRQFARRL